MAEALGIHVQGNEQHTSWNEATSTISVCSSIYRGKEQNRVKTQAAIRTVDLDPRLNAAIAQFVTENKIQPGAFLFQSRSGRTMHLLTAFNRLHKHNVPGFHSFRRFRITWLRDFGCPEDILRYWVGHQGFGITDRYSKLAENVELRKQWSVRAGLGFDISLMGHPAPRIPKKPRKPKPVANVVAQPSEPSYVGVDADLPEFLFEEPVAEEA